VYFLYALFVLVEVAVVVHQQLMRQLVEVAVV
jgi:hypothetical protein